jgi:hypothetical protein
VEFTQAANSLGGQTHFVAETGQSAQEPEQRISALASDIREVIECVAQDQKWRARWFVYGSHLAPLDLEGMEMKRIAAVDLDDDRGPNRFHLLEHAGRGRVVASGCTLVFQRTIELLRNAFSVEDSLLLEGRHRRLRLRWKRSTAALCST